MEVGAIVTVAVVDNGLVTAVTGEAVVVTVT